MCIILALVARAVVNIILTQVTFKSSLAMTNEPIRSRGTRPTMHAWVRLAEAHVNLAEGPLHTLLAYAGEGVDPIDAVTLIMTWITETFVDVDFTIMACESRLAFAGVGSLAINTAPSIQAWFTQAVVLIYLALVTDPSICTIADKTANQVMAHATIGTWVGLTFVDVNVTQTARVTRITSAFVRIHIIDTLPVITSTRKAIILIILAVDSIKPCSTDALVTAGLILTGATIFARSRHALINLNLTKGTGESILAVTGKAVDSIHTDGIIGTRLVGTVVNVGFAMLSYGQKTGKRCIMCRE